MTATFRRLCTLAVAAVLVPAAAAGQSGDRGTTGAHQCCMEATFPLSARMVGLGGAVVADTAPDMALANPAGLAGLRRATLLVHYRKLIADGQLLGVALIGPSRPYGTFATSYTLADGGTLPQTDSLGNQIGTLFYQAHVFQASFATRLGAGLAAGITYKVYLRVVPCDSSCLTGGGGGATQLVDGGAQYHPRWDRWLSVGVGVTNAGIPLQVVNYEQSDPAPARVRAGATYEVLHLLQPDSALRGTLSAQVELAGPQGAIPSLGAEADLGGVLYLRGGWRGGGATGEDAGLAMGIGLKLQHYALSIAKPMMTVSDSGEPGPVYVTFGIEF